MKEKIFKATFKVKGQIHTSFVYIAGTNKADAAVNAIPYAPEGAKLKLSLMSASPTPEGIKAYCVNR